ncbi:MAG: hypothetical protein SFT92_00955 [Rickettsiales bacterium]|nr:hypothetical protein [Rickettsiales bacterium]
MADDSKMSYFGSSALLKASHEAANFLAGNTAGHPNSKRFESLSTELRTGIVRNPQEFIAEAERYKESRERKNTANAETAIGSTAIDTFAAWDEVEAAPTAATATNNNPDINDELAKTAFPEKPYESNPSDLGSKLRGLLRSKWLLEATREKNTDNFIGGEIVPKEFVLERLGKRNYLSPAEIANLQAFPDRYGDFLEQDARTVEELRNVHLAIGQIMSKAQAQSLAELPTIREEAAEIVERLVADFTHALTSHNQPEITKLAHHIQDIAKTRSAEDQRHISLLLNNILAINSSHDSDEINRLLEESNTKTIQDSLEQLNIALSDFQKSADAIGAIESIRTNTIPTEKRLKPLIAFSSPLADLCYGIRQELADLKPLSQAGYSGAEEGAARQEDAANAANRARANEAFALVDDEGRLVSHDGVPIAALAETSTPNMAAKIFPSEYSVSLRSDTSDLIGYLNKDGMTAYLAAANNDPDLYKLHDPREASYIELSPPKDESLFLSKAAKGEVLSTETLDVIEHIVKTQITPRARENESAGRIADYWQKHKEELRGVALTAERENAVLSAFDVMMAGNTDTKTIHERDTLFEGDEEPSPRAQVSTLTVLSPAKTGPGPRHHV